MLTKETLTKLTNLKQTTQENIFREYSQHLFLSALYQQKGSEKLLFKGGTALRIIFQSPRFSEDLDFTAINLNKRQIEDILTETLLLIQRSSVEVELIEGKLTSGGYLALISFSFLARKIEIKLEISLRKTSVLKAQRSLIVNDYLPAFTLAHLPEEILVKEKIQTLLARKKPRDFYDFWFFLAHNFSSAKNKQILNKVLALLKRTKLDFNRELKKFLPVSQAQQVKNFRADIERKILMFLN
ncbi:MAG: nucleotidyl transferase AbiEii/AbiGii toxin family protein [bacterium]|nr:nucleotidyl transferase AbiEii/AbiGii toxin family protein [bacterium]